MGHFQVPCTHGSHFEPSGRGAAVDEFPLQLVRPTCRALVVLPQLKSLIVEGLTLAEESSEAFWLACKDLSYLTLSMVSAKDNANFFESALEVHSNLDTPSLGLVFVCTLACMHWQHPRT